MITLTLLLVLAGTGNPAKSSPAQQQPRVTHDSLYSPALNAWKKFVVYLPPSYEKKTRTHYAVAYYLHGLGGAETDWSARARMDSTADALTAGSKRELIVIMPDGDDSWYMNWQGGAQYADYIARDLVGHVDAKYRTKAEYKHRAIAGLSMGGFGAIRIALQFPKVFSAAASHSGVVSPLLTSFPAGGAPVYATSIEDMRAAKTSYGVNIARASGTDTVAWRHSDPHVLAEELIRSKQKLPAIYIDCGTEDGLITQNRALHFELTRLKIKHEYHEYGGAHSWSYWRLHGGESLAWIADRVAR